MGLTPRSPSRTDIVPFPALLWDNTAGEPRCTGCMACVNYCPTQCMSATLKHNPRHADGQSRRRTLADTFRVALADCIECGICVDMCRYDAITLGIGREDLEADGGALPVLDLEALLSHGRRLQEAPGAQEPRRPDVQALLEAARDRLPPASASDAARRAHSRLRHSLPVRLETGRR